jgi:hypothetical protein
MDISDLKCKLMNFINEFEDSVDEGDCSIEHEIIKHHDRFQTMITVDMWDDLDSNMDRVEVVNSTWNNTSMNDKLYFIKQFDEDGDFYNEIIRRIK